MHDSIKIAYQKLSYNDLPVADRQLVDEAVGALEGAHAPYSRFSVGSAVLLADGAVVTGNNQENAAYPSGLCAERVALFAAKSQTRQPIQAIAIVARSSQGTPADSFACGSCRQVMMEYAGQQPTTIRLLMRDRESNFVVLEDVRALLPFSFGSGSLG